MTKPFVLSFAVAAVLIVCATQPALAVEEVSADATMSLSGELVVLSDEGFDLVHEAGDIPNLAQPDPTMFSVVTDEGSIVTVTGDVPEDAETGDSFTGEVAIPVEVATELDVADGAVVDADSALGAEVVELATSAELPLVVESSEVTGLPIAEVVTLAAHTFDVAVVNPANFPAVATVSDTTVTNMVSAVGQYWVSQTNGQISSVSKPAATLRYTSSSNCATQSLSALANAYWQEAAANFGHPLDYYYTGGGHHLIVILPTQCQNSGSGLGTIGSGIHTGGLQMATAYVDTLLPVVAHEIGHNVGLGHSNLSYCGTPVYDEGSGCSVYQYEDIYSVMGFAVVGYPVLTALPAPMKAALQAYPGGDLLSLSGLGTTTHSLLPASNASGLRGIKAIDAITGEAYYIELRSGSGTDTNAFYMQGGSTLPACDCWGSGPGVRVLKLASGNASVVNAVVTDPGDPHFAYPALYPGEGFESRSGGLKVTVNSLTPAPVPGTGYQPTSASVTISMGAWTGVNPAPTVSRISGPDRYSVAVAISQAGFPTPGVPVVYVTTGANYPDALSAAPAAAKQGGPLLLTPTSSLPTTVRNEIIRLNPAKVVIVGGTGSVSVAVENAIRTLVPDDTIRLGGATRYEASRNIVDYAWGSTGATDVYIATGSNFPDALSASGAGGALDMPVILVPGKLSTVDSATLSLLADLGVTGIKIAGGTGSVSTGIETTLKQIDPGLVRLAGADRFVASKNVARDAFDALNPSEVFIATGYTFPDALAGAVLAGTHGGPLIVVPTNCVPPSVLDALDNWGATSVTLLGGTGSLTSRVQALLPC